MLLIVTEKVPEIISPGIILSAVFTFCQNYIQVKIMNHELGLGDKGNQPRLNNLNLKSNLTCSICYIHVS